MTSLFLQCENQLSLKHNTWFVTIGVIGLLTVAIKEWGDSIKCTSTTMDVEYYKQARVTVFN